MELLAVAWYATICCALAGLAPHVPGRLRRFVLGAIVGGVSALALPVVRTALGV